MDLGLYKQYREIEEWHWWCVGRRAIIFDFLGHYLPLDTYPSLKILDVGCHTGFLVQALQSAGYRASGVDISAEAVAFGRSMGIDNLSVASEERLPFPDRHFNLVLCLDVLEHIKNDRQMLTEIERVLVPGGFLVLMVPAFMLLWGLQDRVAQHFRRYRRTELLDLAAASGFKPQRVSYFNFIFFWPILLIRWWEKLAPPRRSSDFDLNNRVINRILQKIFLLEGRWLRRFNFPFGVSLLAVLEKPDR